MVGVKKKIFRLKIVETKRRIGASKARNLGIRKSKGEIIAFLDDDSIPCKWWLKNLVRAYKYGKTVGGVGGRVVSSLKELNRSSADLPTGIITPFGHVVFNFNSCYRKYVEWIRGCNMSFRKNALCSVGGFDENLDPVSQSEDIDLCLRVRNAGYDIVFEPEAVVIHKSAKKGGMRTAYHQTVFWNIRNTTYIYLRDLAYPQNFVAVVRCFLGTLLLYMGKNDWFKIISSSLRGLMEGLALGLKSKIICW